MKVFIVTEDNGRVQSLHLTVAAAETERDRALAANETWGTGIEEHDISTGPRGDTIAEQEAEHAMHRTLSNFGYGITPRTVAAFLRVFAEYAADAKPDEEDL